MKIYLYGENKKGQSEKKECFNFSNLQPLWISENCAKSSIYNGKKLIHKKN